MRYIKVLVLVVLFFLSMVFLFQNQAALKTPMVLELNLLAIPTMKSIELPFYFVLLASFMAGGILAVIILFWDRLRLTGRLVRANWRAGNLENQQRRLMKELEEIANAAVSERPGIYAKTKATYLQWLEERKTQKQKDQEASRKTARAVAIAKAGKEQPVEGEQAPAAEKA